MFTIPGIGINSVALPNPEKPDPKTVAAKMDDLFMRTMLEAMSDNVDAEANQFASLSDSDFYSSILGGQLPLSTINSTQPVQAEIENNTPTTPINSADSENSSAALPVDGRISSPVGWRPDPFSGQMKFHKGTDIAAPAGSDIRAVEDGVVIESGPKGGYGNAVVVQLADGRKMLYGHNELNLVRVGDRVQRGDVIGRVGSSGHSTGPHVHFEIINS